jgi:hypothetical protein
LVFQDGGNVVFYSTGEDPVWATNQADIDINKHKSRVAALFIWIREDPYFFIIYYYLDARNKKQLDSIVSCFFGYIELSFPVSLIPVLF